MIKPRATVATCLLYWRRRSLWTEAVADGHAIAADEVAGGHGAFAGGFAVLDDFERGVGRSDEEAATI
ncbi:MAG: hypothetical protein L0228_00805 [Planctomycetes bacterium]|nr:hypothetical protein [Planctomycetota bacterium]